MIEYLLSLFKTYKVEGSADEIRTVSVAGIILLGQYVFMPSLSLLFNFDMLANWYELPTDELGYLFVTVVVVIGFIWIYIFFILAGNVRRHARLTKPQVSLKSDECSFSSNYIHILGFASNEGNVIKNLELAERRAKVLERWLKAKLGNSHNILTHPMGEGAFLPHPKLGRPAPQLRQDPGYLSRYAMAFDCGEMSKPLQVYISTKL